VSLSAKKPWNTGPKMLSEYIAERRKTKSPLVMTHVVCGYPSFEDNLKALEIMQSFDVDIVELQFPFSEPSADGPTFVRANQIAIEQGVSVEDCFKFMREVNDRFSFKILMMGYYNTVFKMGEMKFLDRLQQAGGIGFIVPDLPIEEADTLFDAARQRSLSPIVLMTPTNRDARLQDLAAAADGFVYAVARKGVTGAATSMSQELTEFLQRCKQYTELPLAVGFGVSCPADIKFIGKNADIAIIGTAALRAWEEGKEEALHTFFSDLLIE
jgi:tryptophan synthase alpha chain